MVSGNEARLALDLLGPARAERACPGARDRTCPRATDDGAPTSAREQALTYGRGRVALQLGVHDAAIRVDARHELAPYAPDDAVLAVALRHPVARARRDLLRRGGGEVEAARAVEGLQDF